MSQSSKQKAERETPSVVAEPLAIVGIGCLFPKADSLDAYWANIRAGVDCITDVPPTHWRPDDYLSNDPNAPDMTYARRGGFLDAYPFDPLRYGISPNNLEATDASQLLGMVVAEHALRDAGYATGKDADDGRAFDRDRTSVILGVTGTLQLVIPLGARLGHPLWRKALAEAGVSKEVADDVVARIADGYVPWQENSFPGLLGNVAAGRIANRFDLGGTNCVVDAACASSLSALHMAAMELYARRADMVLTGGFDTFNDIFMFMCFSKTPALSPTGDSRPFSADGDGTILGEGLGMVVLKRLADARRDGDRIYAVIRGIGSSSDGRGNAIYAPSATGQMKALRSAYRTAGVSPRSIELVEAHGTGTKVGDLTEVTSLAEVFRQDGGEGTWCATGSVKSMIGHTKAAAGVAGLIKAALALSDKVLPPTLKISQPLDPLMPGASPAYANTLARPWTARDGHPRRAALSAFGFGGSNFHCVLEEAESAKRETRWDGRVQIVAVSAATPEAVSSQLAPYSSPLAWKEFRELAAASRRSFDARDACRLTFVVDRERFESDSNVVSRMVETARKMLAQPTDKPRWSTPDGIYFAAGPAPGKLAVLFPGQGSQYVYMQRELACQFPEMLAALELADQAFQTSNGSDRLCDLLYPPPAFSDAQRDAQELRLRATDVAQPALGAASLGAWRVLEFFGLRGDMFAGHSFGELVALCAAGRLTDEDLATLAAARGRLMAEAKGSDASSDRGAMLAVTAARDVVERELAEARLNVVVANHNAPQQVVLSGESTAIAEAEQWFASRRIRASRLAVSAAFHSPLVAAAEAQFAACVEQTRLNPGAAPVFANSTAREYPNGARAARRVLAGQLARPVEFVAEIEALYECGARSFVEIGPQAKLCGLVRSILSGREHVAAALDVSAGKRGGQTDLAFLLAELSALGYGVDVAKWDPIAPPAVTAKKPTLVVPLSGANYVKPRPARPPRTTPGTAAPPTSSAPAKQSPEDVVAPKVAPAVSRVLPASPATALPAPAAMPEARPSATLHASKPQTPSKTTNSVPSSPAVVASVPQGTPAPRSIINSMDLDQALRLNEQSILALERMQEQTAALHRQYLDGQIVAQRTVEQLVEQQQSLLSAALGLPSAAGAIAAHGLALSPPIPLASPAIPAAVPMAPPAPMSAPARAVQPTSSPTHAVVATIAPHDAVANVPAQAEPVRSPAPISSPVAPAVSLPIAPSALTTASSVASERLASTLLEVVSEKTGYPVETLELGMSLDSDLGIDSIKRVEIMSAMQERLPDAPPVKPDDLGRLQTLGQIVAFLGASAATAQQTPLPLTPPPTSLPTPAISPAAASADFAAVLLDVVAEKTGYPAETLELDMSLDADLGIDSIKRVEIMSAMQERLPEAPVVRPEDLGRLQTLRQIVAFLGAARTNSADPTLPAASPSAAPSPANRPGVQPTVAIHERLTKVEPQGEQIAAQPAAATTTLDRRVLCAVPLADAEAANRQRIVLSRNAEFWIASDGGRLAEALRRKLIADRIVARVVPLDAVPGDRAICGLCIVAPENASSDIAFEAFRLMRRVGPALRETARRDAAVLASVSWLDGNFGLSEGKSTVALTHPKSGALAGLVKTAAHEWPEVACKAIDADASLSADVLAAAIANELFAAGPIEVGVSAAGRRQSKLVTEPTPATSHAPFSRGDVVVVSGGARGVAAEAAVAVARRFGATMLLVGRSSEPTEEPAWAVGIEREVDLKRAIVAASGGPIAPKVVEFQCRRILANREIAGTIARINAAGGRAVYRSVDIRDAASLRPVLVDARKNLGSIRGVIHAAGVLADRLIEDKTDEQFAEVWSTKVDGCEALLAATTDDDLAAIAFFSSSTARFGRKGQVDYAAANEVLNKIAQREVRRRPLCRVVSVNWGPWDGGMVTPALKKLFAAEGVGVIGLDAGAELLAIELAAPAGSAVEVVVLGPRPGTSLDATTAPATTVAPSPPQPPGQSVPRMNLSFQREISVDTCPVLRSHVINHRAVLPMALMVEWLAHGALHDNPGLELLGFDDLRVFKGVILESDGATAIRVMAAPPEAHEGAEMVQAELHSGNTLHARARIILGSELPSAMASLSPAEGTALADPNIYDGRRLFHGADLHGIVRVDSCGPLGIVGEARTAPPPNAWIEHPLRSRWLADPLALDAAFQLMIVWCFERRAIASLPTRIGRYRQFAREFPADGARIVIRVDRETAHQADATIEFVDQRGRLVARIEGYECVIDASLNEAFLRKELAAPAGA